MVVDPAPDDAGRGGALADAVGAGATAGAGRAVEEVLLQAVAGAGAEGGRGAGYRAGLRVAGVGIVCVDCQEGSRRGGKAVVCHDRLALHVARGAVA